MSDITVINDTQQSELVTNGLAKNGELYLKAAGSTDAGAIVVYDSGSWRTFANEYVPAGFVNQYSIHASGTNDSIDIGDISSIAGGQSQLSISMWFNLPSTSGVHGLLGSSNFFGETYYYNQIVAQTFVTNVLKTAGTVTANTWNHFAITYNAGFSTWYNNGTAMTTRTDTATTTDSACFNNLKLGTCPRFSQYGNVKIDEFAVFQTELSSTDITAIYNSGVPTDLTSYSPVGWWRMGDNDSGTGTTVTDQGSGGNDATLTNSPTFSTDVPS